MEDLGVSGQMTWDYNYPGSVNAHIKLAGTAVNAGELDITWDSRVPLAQAVITGKIGGREIAATMYAP